VGPQDRVGDRCHVFRPHHGMLTGGIGDSGFGVLCRVRGLAVHENCVRVTRELPKSEFPISERKSIDSSGPRESEGPGGSSLLGEGQVRQVLMRSMMSTCPRVGASCYPRFLGITRRSCLGAHRS
jgi:hypothetical protein